MTKAGSAPEVLIFAYYWPPSGGSAVQRWLTFANHLARAGWKPIVIAPDPDYATFPAIDESLIEQIHPQVEVHRTRTSELFWIYRKYIGKGKVPAAGFANESEPNLLQKAARFVRGNFFIPDPRKGWNEWALKQAREVLKSRNIRCIITAGPPHSTHLIGQQLKKETGLPWLTDFHDAWTDIWFYDKFLRTSWAMKRDQQLERQVLEQADRVVTVGQQLKEALAGKSGAIGIAKIHVLSMGYDPDLLELESCPPQHELLITYTGTAVRHYHPEVFFDALAAVAKEHPQVPVKLHFYGLLDEYLERYAHQCGLDNMLEVKGYVPHQESVKQLFASSYLLLLNPQIAKEDLIIPGKVYEYLAARKPIINIGSRTADTARIVASTEAGVTFERQELEPLKEHLRELFRQWQQRPNQDLPMRNSIVEYSREEEGKELELVLEGLTR